MWQLRYIAIWGRLTSRQSFSALVGQHISWCLIAFSLLLLYVTLWPWPLILNTCSVSPVTWWNSVLNLSEIEQFPAELMTILHFFSRGRLSNSSPQGVDQTAPYLGRNELHHPFTKQETLIPMRCFVSKRGRLKEEWCRRSRPNFALFDPL